MKHVSSSRQVSTQINSTVLKSWRKTEGLQVYSNPVSLRSPYIQLQYVPYSNNLQQSFVGIFLPPQIQQNSNRYKLQLTSAFCAHETARITVRIDRGFVR
jgi:hypothetical protein